MQTQSHLLLTAFGGDWLNRYRSDSISMAALLIGSVLPDLPFWLLTILGELWFLYIAPLPGVGKDASIYQIMVYLHFDRFFTDPLWIVSHNFFHSLVINTVIIALGWWQMRHGRRWGTVLFWLGISTQFHTVLDVFTHTTDGPLLFFPLNWTYRFASPVSYWEEGNFGHYVMTAEWLLNGLIVGYFVLSWLRTRFAHRDRRTSSSKASGS